jgi:hypothetical protein
MTHPKTTKAIKPRKNPSLLLPESAGRKRIKESMQLPNCPQVSLLSSSYSNNKVQAKTAQAIENQRLPIDVGVIY